MKQYPSCSVIIVTHNSERFLEKTMKALVDQTVLPKEVLIVDAASKSTDYLHTWTDHPLVHLLSLSENVGFCLGNNIGWKRIDSTSNYLLFLNPDLILPPNFLQEALSYLEDPSNKDVAALTTPLLGYSIEKDSPTGLYDSTGIIRTKMGFWRDRDQGVPVNPDSLKEENLTAICGALMLCRREALEEVLLPGGDIFDPSFYMYKEDIDLSLRLTARGWKLRLLPLPPAFHCRGWAKTKDRKEVSRKFKLMAARNDVKVDWRGKSPYLLFSIFKWLGVKLFNV